MIRRLLFFVLLSAITVVAPRALAQSNAAQGVAVLAANGARDDAFALARALYLTNARPRSLDEIRVRILAGDAPPAGAIKDLRELSELRASIAGEDAASRRLLASIAQQLGLQAIVVVSSKPGDDADAGTIATARLFVAETGDFDAARWDPVPGEAPWQTTATSIAARFPGPPPAPPPAVIPSKPLPKPPPEKRESTPFYKSPWVWGAIGAALVIGGIFFFATRDKAEDPIHVRMTVPP